MKITSLLLICLASCQTIVDPSIKAAEAGDFTIMASACEALPGRGADICHVKEGSEIGSDWTMIMPTGKALLGGELTVYYKDISKTYAINGPIVRVPWADLIGHDNWESADDGQALALAQIRYKNNAGIEEIVRARGLAIIVVTKPGYSPMSIDSGFATFQTICKIQYATSGRSAISCK
jgi:hypothetical protein